MIKIILLLLLLLTTNALGKFLPKTFVVNFEQSYISKKTNKPKKSNGTIHYLFPGHIRFELHGENPITFVSNPKKTWYYRPTFIPGEKGTLRMSGTQNMVVAKFFDALKHGLKSNDMYKVKGNKLSFSEKSQKETGVKTALLEFKADKEPVFSNINSIQLEFSDGKKVTLSFEKMKINLSKSKKEFIFKIPPNTDIIE